MRIPSVLLVLGLLLPACGGSQQEPATPGAPGAPGVGVPGAPGAAAPTGQYAISDAPSSGEAVNRPKMNASAAEAYEAGLTAFRNGDLEGARTQFSRATQADSSAFQAFYSLGVVRERLGENEGALSAYRQAAVIVSDYEPAIAAYGVLAARLGKTTEAEDFLQQKKARLPKSAAVDAALAEVKSIQGDSGAAQKLAQEALKKNPDYRPAMITIARDHYRTRRLDLALYTLRGILDGFGPENPPRDPNSGEARLLRGLIYREQGSRKLAIDDFRKAIEQRPDLVEARLNLAAYLLESGNAPEAAQLLEGALRYDKQNVMARLNLGDAYRLLGKTAEAKRELDWVASKDSSLAAVHYNLGLLYLFSDNVPGVQPKQAADRAIEEFEQYKRMKPRSAGPDDTEELIARAKSKKALIDSKEQEAAAQKAAAAPPPAPAATPPSSGAMPAASPEKPASSGALPPAGGGTTPNKSTGSLPAVKGGK